MLAIIKAELQAIKAKYATPRLTDLVPDAGEIAIEDLIVNEGVIITLTHAGLIKRTNISSYRAQRRGGKGVIGMTTREGQTEEDKDFIEHLFTASTHDHLMPCSPLLLRRWRNRLGPSLPQGDDFHCPQCGDEKTSGDKG